MKISFNRKIRRSPWGGGAHFLSAIMDKLSEEGHEVTSKLEKDVDAIVMLDPRYEEGGYSINDILKFKHFNPKVRLIHRVNDTDIARGTHFLDDLMFACWETQAFDHVVFISRWLKDYYLDGRFDLKTPSSVILNGCNHKFYFPSEKERKSDKIKLVTHHWSDNINKGFKLYDHIDRLLDNEDFSSRFEFTFIGRYNKETRRKNVKIIDPLYGKDLGDELRKHDVYVTAAKHEACGMHHIEGMSCGLPVLFHKDGGGVVEVCESHGGVQFNSLDDFCNKLDIMMKEFFERRDIIRREELSIDNVIEKYKGVILSEIDN